MKPAESQGVSFIKSALRTLILLGVVYYGVTWLSSGNGMGRGGLSGCTSGASSVSVSFFCFLRCGNLGVFCGGGFVWLTQLRFSGYSSRWQLVEGTDPTALRHELRRREGL